MGSATHIQGVPQRPGLASRRDYVAVRERDRERTADVRTAIYVTPMGRGLHLVRNFCNNQEYTVGSRAGITFSPGSQVLLGSNTGHPGEVIVAEPPPGKKGGSVFGGVAAIRVTSFEAPEETTTPSLLATYIGLFRSSTTLTARIIDSSGVPGAQYGVNTTAYSTATINGVFGAIQRTADDAQTFIFFHLNAGTNIRAYNMLTGAGMDYHMASGRYTYSRVLAREDAGYWVEVSYSAPNLTFHLMQCDSSLNVTELSTINAPTGVGHDTGVGTVQAFIGMRADGSITACPNVSLLGTYNGFSNFRPMLDFGTGDYTDLTASAAFNTANLPEASLPGDGEEVGDGGFKFRASGPNFSSYPLWPSTFIPAGSYSGLHPMETDYSGTQATRFYQGSPGALVHDFVVHSLLTSSSPRVSISTASYSGVYPFAVMLQQ